MVPSLLSSQIHGFFKSKTGQMTIGLIIGDGTLTPHRFEHSKRSLYYEYSKHISEQFQKEYPELLTPKMRDDFFMLGKKQTLSH